MEPVKPTLKIEQFQPHLETRQQRKEDFLFMPWGQLDTLDKTITFWANKRIELGLNKETDEKIIEARAIALVLRTVKQKKE